MGRLNAHKSHAGTGGIFAKGAAMGSGIFQKGSLGFRLPTFEQVKQGVNTAKQAVGVARDIAGVVETVAPFFL